MRALPNDLRQQLEAAVLEGRRAAESAVRAALSSLGVAERDKPEHLDAEQAQLRRGLRAKCRQLGGHPEQDAEVLVWDAAYEQWHRLLFARFLAENGLLRHPQFGAPVTLAECEELAEDLGEPDGWSVAARFASEILPGIFRLEDPCVRMRLAPEHRVALERVVAGLPVGVFAADDSLGWVYQYWQSERKDLVNSSEVKIGGADLGPVTQLFTENYMVRFLLENSLGAWWAARCPNSALVEEFQFLRFDDDEQPAAGSFDGWPEAVGEVTVMDPCCGSGHFLVEAFGMLWRMRAEEEGLDPVAAQDAVLRDNLFGLELDPRCVQIAIFALALTAWKQGGGWRELPIPNVACSGIPAKSPLEEWTALADDDESLTSALERLHALFRDADTLGSLIDPRRAAEMANVTGLQRAMHDVDFDEVAPLLAKAAGRETDDPATAVLGADAAGIAHAASLLSSTYTLIATNPPYLGQLKQSDALKAHVERSFQAGRSDLAVAFLARAKASVSSGTVVAVSPAEWLVQSRTRDFRRTYFCGSEVSFVIELGYDAFRTGIRAQPTLTCVTGNNPAPGASTFWMDLRDANSSSAKSVGLRESPLRFYSQTDLCDGDEIGPAWVDARNHRSMKDLVEVRAGLKAGDVNRFEFHFWEVDTSTGVWEYLQGSPRAHGLFTGRSAVVRWENESGSMAELAESVKHLNHVAQNWRRGKPLWGKRGVCIALMGQDLPATLYEGDRYSSNCTAVVPHDPNDRLALWAFAASGEWANAVRRWKRALAVDPHDLANIPFDVERWRQVAMEKFPEGLPEPSSDDPTQWLFRGRPEVATEPLQVGVGRLVGYRWPEQAEPDELDELDDRDGIVCLPAVGGESPAADRLIDLLSAAYGKEWSLALVRQHLEQAGSKKKSLGDWLRDDFFKHHCKVFANRPFVWHIWDGRKDGFSALVNYHRLDRARLGKLTFTYLGYWIERQRSDAVEDIAGADVRLAAARDLKTKLEAILEGEPPYDVYVRWKELHEQSIGWDPDFDDGVRLNIRPFVEAGILRSRVGVHWKKDRGKNPDGSERHNDLHYTHDQKHRARQKAGNA